MRSGSVEQEMSLEDFMKVVSNIRGRWPDDRSSLSGSLVDGMFVATWSEIVWQDSATRKSMHSFQRRMVLKRRRRPQPGQRLYYPPTKPEFEGIKKKMDSEWLPQLLGALGMSLDELPLLWDADLMFGPKTDSGEDTFVLCEINVSSVYPYRRMRCCL